VLVPVLLVLGVPVALVRVVDVVVVRDGDVPAALAMRMLVTFVGGVAGDDTFVNMVFVRPVQVTVVDVVDVIPMRDGGVPTIRTVRVVVADVRAVVSCSRHCVTLHIHRRRLTYSLASQVVRLRLTVTAFAGKRLTWIAVADT
jgi:hypothetical protein